MKFMIRSVFHFPVFHAFLLWNEGHRELKEIMEELGSVRP